MFTSHFNQEAVFPTQIRGLAPYSILPTRWDKNHGKIDEWFECPERTQVDRNAVERQKLLRDLGSKT